MAGPGRPPKNISELNAQISTEGDIVEVVEPPKKKAKKERDEYVFQMVGDFPKDSQGVTRYPGLSLDNVHIVYDEDRGIQRTARLLVGIDTFWLDEQKELNDKFASRNKPNLSFNNGQLIVPAHDKNTLKYLQLRSDFEGCKRPVMNRKIRFKLLNTEADEQMAWEKKQKQKEASDLAAKTSIDMLIPHAKYLGISFYNDKGFQKSEDALRHAYVNKAEAQPDLFLKTYNNPKVKMYGLVKTAFEESRIVYVDGQALWSDTKAVICQVPHERQSDVAGYLAELMLTKEGVELRSQLETL